MKRGLKVMMRNYQCYHFPVRSYNRFPDEKGTESLFDPVSIGCYPRPSYNRFPDEKGTESLHRHVALLIDTVLQSFPR